MKPNDQAILTTGLTKRFAPDILAVDQLDLAIPTNTIYALLGPNGAGKTTCHLSGYTGPCTFTHSGPGVFTQTGPPVFANTGPLVLTQTGPGWRW
jgi:ABC-type uncharacterized transport system ATPase subunit